MVLHRLLRHTQRLGDLPVGPPVGEVTEDRPLPWREAREPGVLPGALPQQGGDPLDHRRIEERATRANLADCRDDVGAPNLFEEVAHRATHDGVEHRLIVGVGGEHQTRDLRHRTPDGAAQLDPGSVGEPDVEQGDVGTARGDPVERLLHRARLADHFDVVLELEEVVQPAAHHLVVVDEEHPHRHPPTLPHAMEAAPDTSELQRLLLAVLKVGAGLDLTGTLHRVVATAVDLARARYGALGILDPSRQELGQFLTVGVDDETRALIGPAPRGHGILGTLIADPRPLRLADLSLHPDSHGFPPHHPPMRSFLGVPILIGGTAYGNLYICDSVDPEGFSALDEEMVVLLAASASVAIENSRLHERVAKVALLEDRERIARDLHDTVIQRLFALGLTMQSVTRLIDDPDVRSRLDEAVDALDDTVRDIRSLIFELHQVRAPGSSVRQGLLSLCAEVARALGTEPAIRFEGPVDTVVDGPLAEHVLAVTREALSNVARHAHASKVTVRVAASADEVSIEVRDDGVGFDPAERQAGEGLANITSRAEATGGGSEVHPAEGGGTVVRWWAPLRPSVPSTRPPASGPSPASGGPTSGSGGAPT